MNGGFIEIQTRSGAASCKSHANGMRAGLAMHEICGAGCRTHHEYGVIGVFAEGGMQWQAWRRARKRRAPAEARARAKLNWGTRSYYEPILTKRVMALFVPTESRAK